MYAISTTDFHKTYLYVISANECLQQFDLQHIYTFISTENTFTMTISTEIYTYHVHGIATRYLHMTIKIMEVNIGLQELRCMLGITIIYKTLFALVIFMSTYFYNLFLHWTRIPQYWSSIFLHRSILFLQHVSIYWIKISQGLLLRTIELTEHLKFTERFKHFNCIITNLSSEPSSRIIKSMSFTN